LEFSEESVQSLSQGSRSFNDWWDTVPADLKEKARRGEEKNG
jgi:hypothetical protein